ncbi:MAG: hypothetical protein EOP87_00060 [Verrucomicrobiaceae bacterium]|nr:MAG: hypothetical protein EOP87_00060 [Verrucomicrobiaceae bacterium]
MNAEEFDDAEEIVKKTNLLAQRFYRRMLPRNTVPRTLHSTNNPHAELAWEMACEAHNFHFPAEDPAELLDALNNALNAQPDPCDADRAARLDAA